MIFRIISFIIGYLFGCFQTAFIIGKLVNKIDIREHGSGNSGTTNAIRVLGWKMGAITFFADIGKAVIAVLICYLIFDEGVFGVYSGLGVIIGHIWPVFLKFKGGKGIASSIGTMLAINPIIGLVMAVIMATTLSLTKYVSLGSILMVSAIPILMVLLYKTSLEYILIGSLITVITLFKHKENIKRLLSGEESKIGHKREV